MATSDLVIDNIIYEIGKRIYPVGSIYISLNSTDPGTLFGGSWVRIYDTVLRAVDSDETPATSPTSLTATYVGSNSVTLSKYQLPRYVIGFLPTIVMNNHNYWSNSGTTGTPGNDSRHAIYASSWNNSTTGGVPSGATNVIKGNNNDGPTSDTQWGWRIYSRDNWTSQQSVNILPRHLDVYMWRRTA